MPFSQSQFLEVFKEYNLAIFPLQIVFVLLAIFCVVLLFRESATGYRIITLTLSLLWCWIGIVYHFIFFSAINKAAYFFSLLFIVQSIIFFYLGIKKTLSFEPRKDFAGVTGWIFIVYSLLVYPILGTFLGHGYPYQPTFGLPCPTTIFTFGLLLFSKSKLRWYSIILPFIWSIIGFTAAIKLGIFEDIGLFIAGLGGFIILLRQKQENTV